MTSPPRSSADARARWRAAAARVAAASTALGRRYEEHTAPFVGRIDPDRLDALADAGLALRREGGWRGERLAHELFARAPEALPLLAAEEVGRWAALALRCAGGIDEVELLRALPQAIGGWDDDLRARWLDAALAAPPALGVLAYRTLPAALSAVPAGLRPGVLAAWRAAAEAGSPSLADVTPIAGALLGAVPAIHRTDAVALLAEVAAAFPAGVPALLRSLPRLYDDALPDRVRAWAAAGLGIAARHAPAGVAFFELASRTSQRVLAASPTAVTLDEAQGVLRRVVLMLSATPAVPRAAGAFTLRPPLEDVPASPMVAMPAAIDRQDTVEDNVRLYGVSAALLAGRREFGTYAALPDGAGRLRGEARPGALEDCFLLADGVRVAARLGAAYPGIGAELRWAADLIAGTSPDPAGVFDALAALAIRPPLPAGLPPWLAATARLVLPSLVALAEPAATAADALAVAERLAPLFPEPERGEQGLGVLPELITLLLDPAPGDEVPTGAADGGLTGPAAAGDDDEPPIAADDAVSLLVDHLADDAGAGRPIDAETLRRLVEALGADALAQARGDALARAGLYVTQLVGKRLAEAGRRTDARPVPIAAIRAVPSRPEPDGDPVYRYDEWDHLIDDYRPAWCTLREVALPGDSGLYFDHALARHADLVPEVRRHFQRLRPERYRRVHGLEDGDVIDLNAVVDARVQHRARRPASPKLYASRRRAERDVATLFLVDLSASTDETAPGADSRIIEITKDALVIMTAALEEIGDAYAVYGFSGQGRDRVEVYPVKGFAERLTPAVQSRIGGLEPRGSTRMGTALRHALARMAGVAAPSRHLVLLSDGFPQDLDYGTDRTSHTYGIRDTAVALREVERAGIKPFCITVDLAGHDYLRQMCAPERYLVIETVSDLPRQLPKIYQRLVRAA